MGSASGFVHDMLVFGSDDELVRACTPFLLDGIAAGELVIVHGSAHDVDVLREALDDDPQVAFLPGTSMYPGMMGAIAHYQRLCARENDAGRGVRSTGPVPFGDDPVMRAEWMRYEAMVDRALGPYRFRGLCHYDTRSTPADLMEFAMATHTSVVTAGGSRPTDRPADGPDLERASELAVEPLPIEAHPVVVADPDVAAPKAVRASVRDALHASGVDARRAEQFVMAVNEVVTNALVHGRSPVQVRLHTDGRNWLCVVNDDGPGIADPYAGIDSPLAPRPAGSGLWLARQFADRMSIGSGPRGGARIRLYLDSTPGH